MAVLEPNSGYWTNRFWLDIDALQIVSRASMRCEILPVPSLWLPIHQRLLNYVTPDFVHVLARGRIVKSGGKDLALELKRRDTVGLKINSQSAVTAS